MRISIPLWLGLFLLPLGCGSGETDGPRPGIAPRVIQFSPAFAEFDLATGAQAAVPTNDALTMNTDPAFPGRAVVYFLAGTVLDEPSFFIAGDPLFGVDLTALSFFRRVTGVGLVPVNYDLAVFPDHVTLTPLAGEFPLASGGYTIRVGPTVRDTSGNPLVSSPVFHTFYVTADPDGPFATKTAPGNGAMGIASGVSSPDIVIEFSEGIDSLSVTSTTIFVRDVKGVPMIVPPAAGYPRLQVVADGTTLPSNGHVVIWRSLAGFPPNTTLELTIQGFDGGATSSQILDLNGVRQENSLTVTFDTGL